jgi:hypothetical protein
MVRALNDGLVRVVRDAGPLTLVLVFFVFATVLLRGRMISDWSWLNQDEAELMAQARAALTSPVPFTTWTMGTTGPFWVLFLAALGWLGYPLTLAFAHLLSAILAGILGFLVFVLMRRSFGTKGAVALSVAWWLPLALVFPVGGRTDFGALSTESLPSVLVLAAAALPPERLASRPWLFGLSGLFCALAIGSKYQVLPVAAAIVVVQLVSLRAPLRGCVAPMLWFAFGAVVPVAAVAVSVAASPDVSLVLLQQNLGFLNGYVGGMSFGTKVANTVTLLIGEPFLVPLVALVVWFSVLSTRRILLCRIVLVAGGLSSVLLGGNGFGHYLLLLFVALGVAASLPTREGVRPVPSRGARRATVATAVVLAIAAGAVGIASGKFLLSPPSVVVAALSPDSVIREPGLRATCPAGSRVLVWGWAPELYVANSWHNSVPFMNTLGLLSSASSARTSAPFVESAIDTSDCVIDAVGPPFFGLPNASITTVYPGSTAALSSQYRIAPNAISCESCTVYVRR